MRLAAAFVLAFLLWRLLRSFLRWEMESPLSLFLLPGIVRWAGRLMFLSCCYVLVLLGIFGLKTTSRKPISTIIDTEKPRK